MFFECLRYPGLVYSNISEPYYDSYININPAHHDFKGI